MSLLKQSEQHRQFHNDDRQQISIARREAEALFRPKPQSVEPYLPADPLSAEAPARKPRILSTSPLPVTRTIAAAAARSKPQPKHAVSVSQLANAHRAHRKGARAAIFKQQDELQAKLNPITSSCVRLMPTKPPRGAEREMQSTTR
jgi:hypothetical protein